jgi:hypothetical protein
LSKLRIEPHAAYPSKPYHSQIDCKQRAASLESQIEQLKNGAHERLKIGTQKTDVARFFEDQGIPFIITESEARGTLPTSGCSPIGCGTDAALIGLRVKLNREGTVADEPTVMGMYTDCL